MNAISIATAVIFFIPIVEPVVAFQQGDEIEIASDSQKRQQAEFYESQVVQDVFLDIAPDDWKKMHSALPKCIYVPATFRWKTIEIKNVGVRFKGNSSANPQQKHKRSFLVKFTKFDSQKNFAGLDRVSFDNGVQFGSLFSEPIITEILRDLGLKSYRCNYAKLHVNGEFSGVYVNVERIDQSYLTRNFSGEKGGLWKNDLGGPGGNLRFAGDDPSMYTKAFEAKNKIAEKEFDKLVQFIKQVNQTHPDDFGAQVESLIDLDSFLKTTAVMLLSGAFDQLTGWGPHNYYLYQDKSANRWHYIPWDLDVGFCEVAFGRVFVIKDWNAAWPVPAGHRNILLDRIIQQPELLARYRRIALEILNKYFEPNRLNSIIDQKYSLIKRHLESDPFPKVRVTVPQDKSYEQIVESIKSFVRKRYESAKRQLENPGPRPQQPTQPKPSFSGEAPIEIRQKIDQVMKLARQKQQALQELDRIMRQVGPLMKQGKFDEAKKLLDRAEKIAK